MFVYGAGVVRKMRFGSRHENKIEKRREKNERRGGLRGKDISESI